MVSVGLLELPRFVVEGTDITGVEPLGDAVVVEGVVAGSPSDLAAVTLVLSLALEAEFSEGVAADGALFDGHVVLPIRHRVPLFDFEADLVGSTRGR